MNKKLIGFLLILALPLSVVATPLPAATSQNSQDGSNYHRGKHKIERLVNELNLNPEQKTKVEAIFSEQKTKFKALREETKNQIKGILSPEQISKFDKKCHKDSDSSEIKTGSENTKK